jgi:hypothetical protein
MDQLQTSRSPDLQSKCSEERPHFGTLLVLALNTGIVPASFLASAAVVNLEIAQSQALVVLMISLSLTSLLRSRDAGKGLSE